MEKGPERAGASGNLKLSAYYIDKGIFGNQSFPLSSSLQSKSTFGAKRQAPILKLWLW